MKPIPPIGTRKPIPKIGARKRIAQIGPRPLHGPRTFAVGDHAFIPLLLRGKVGALWRRQPETFYANVWIGRLFLSFAMRQGVGYRLFWMDRAPHLVTREDEEDTP